MKYSQIKTTINFCNDLFSTPDHKEVIDNVLADLDDFEVDNVRFIKDEQILPIMVDEIFSDDYLLGCFSADFIADNSDLNYDLVRACQNSEAYEAIGTALNDTLDQGEKEEFCDAYASADGFGHHFNHYDFGEEEIEINGILFHVFDQH